MLKLLKYVFFTLVIYMVWNSYISSTLDLPVINAFGAVGLLVIITFLSKVMKK